MPRKIQAAMRIIACKVPDSDGTLISPFQEYMKRYDAPPDGETPKQRDKREQRKRKILAFIKHVWENNGEMKLPPVADTYENRRVSIIKIKLSNCLIRIAFFTIENKIVLLESANKPKLYEKAKKNKVDREIQNFLDKAEHNLEIYMIKSDGIDITSDIVG